MINLGGCGGEGFGDPLGGGGGLHLVRVLAVAGQVVRAVFNKSPRAKSPAANSDGLNGTNYVFTVVTGSASTPLCVSARGVVSAPALGVNVGEVAIDLQTDRPLVTGLEYSLAVSSRVLAFDGDTMGYPYSQPFVGATRPARKRQDRAKQGIIDLASGANGLVVENGDIGTVSGIPSARMRCARRTMTMKGAFAHLPGYGIGFKPKAPLSVNRLGALKVDLLQQLKAEPDVQDAAAAISMDTKGIVTIDEKIKTKRNQTFTFTVANS